jgi:serine/threonine-protein kinase
VRSLFERDQVLDQDPDPGERAEKGSPVTLEVSSGPGKVTVPSVRNLPRERAVRELNKADLKVTLDEQPSSSVRKGFAIRTVPSEGAEVERGTRVRLFVSSGPQQVTVPDVVGLSRDSAEERITSEGLDVAVREQESNKREDEVIGQSPGGGSRVERGATVTITVSKGREKVDVPNVEGLDPADAARLLRAEGLRPARRERVVDDQSQDGIVIDQRPAAGVELERGRSVLIVVGTFEEPAAPPPAQPPPAP